MVELGKCELLSVHGGFSLSGTLINSFVRGISIFLELGRSMGSAIRRIIGSSYCPL